MEEQRKTVDAAIYAAEREVSAGEELLDAAEVHVKFEEKNIYEKRSVPGGISASKYIFFMKSEIINNGSISAVKLSYCRNAIDFKKEKGI